jgi:hypothetical protein
MNGVYRTTRGMVCCNSFWDHRNNLYYLGKLTDIYFLVRISVFNNTSGFINSRAKLNEVHETNRPTCCNSSCLGGGGREGNTNFLSDCNIKILDFKFSPCSVRCMFSFG